jgi:23S rRNA (adenine-N6)-dimethyltransferase
MPRSRSVRPPVGGPHELGQNLLIDEQVAARMTAIVQSGPPAPVVDLGAGDGALTRPLAAAGMAVTAVELDPRKAAQLRRTFGKAVHVVEADLLGYEYGGPHHVASNVPFGLTTPVLRRLLRQRTWHTAALLLQWEVARKRAGVGGTTMLTASWWPWYEFTLVSRVPATAFAPRPSVDGGILAMYRRECPLVPSTARAAYQGLVGDVFTGRGRGLAAVLRRRFAVGTVRGWLGREGLRGDALPRDLTASQWASLYRLGRRASP